MPYKVGYIRPCYKLSGKRLGLEEWGWEILAVKTLEDSRGLVAVSIDKDTVQERFWPSSYLIKGDRGFMHCTWRALMNRTLFDVDGAYLVVDNYLRTGEIVGVLRPSKMAWGKFEFHFFNPMYNQWGSMDGGLWHGSARELIRRAQTCYEHVGLKFVSSEKK